MHRLHVLSLLAFTALLGACGGGASGETATGTGPSTEIDVFLGATGSSDLFALHACVEGVRLVAGDGTRTPNLLAQDTDVELVGLSGYTSWLAHGAVEYGAYEAVEVDFERDSLRGAYGNGTSVNIAASAGPWRVDLDQPLVLGDDPGPRVHLELDLPASLQGSGSSMMFEPAGDHQLDIAQMPVTGLRGTVFAGSLIEDSLTLDARLSSGAPLGLIEVRLVPGTRLVSPDGSEYASKTDFFASLSLGITRVEVDGLLDSDGEVRAGRIEVEDDGDQRVEIEGMVLHVGASSFVMLIRGIERGAEIAAPVLDSIGNPSSIDVFWDSGTRFVLRDGTAVGPGSLQVGQIVDAEFDVFVFPPFVASKVELAALDIHVQGTIVDTTGLPDSFTLRVDDDEVALAGQDVTVDTTGARVELDTQFNPTISASQLVRGIKARVTGRILGDSSEASLVVARHGRFHKANVSATDPALSSFWTDGSQITKTFGDPVNEGPLRVEIEPRARFGQDASSEPGFFALFDGLDPDERLDVKVRGIAAGPHDEVLAFEIKAKVRHDNGQGGGNDDDDDDDDGSDD